MVLLICEGKIIYVDIYDYLSCFNINSFGSSNILYFDFFLRIVAIDQV